MAQTRQDTGRGLANVYLADWDSAHIPLQPLRDCGWLEEADTVLTRLNDTRARTPVPRARLAADALDPCHHPGERAPLGGDEGGDDGVEPAVTSLRVRNGDARESCLRSACCSECEPHSRGHPAQTGQCEGRNADV